MRRCSLCRLRSPRVSTRGSRRWNWSGGGGAGGGGPARERRKRVSAGAMNRFLDKIDFQRASVPMNRRVKIYYMTQAAVAPPTFVLFTDRDVKLHFSYERFLANEIRAAL